MADADWSDTDLNSHLVTTTAETLTLDPDKAYSIAHTGMDDSGADSILTVFMAVDSDPAAVDYSVATNLFFLTDGMTVVVGPGVSALHVDRATGSTDVVITSVAGPPHFGNV